MISMWGDAKTNVTFATSSALPKPRNGTIAFRH
jgi:hypothetical protein